MSLIKLNLPSYIELSVLLYANYCPTCNIYDYHTIGVCELCDNPICKYTILFKYNNKLVCKKCRNKISITNRLYTFEAILNK